jgi:hypothetical protein
MLESSDKTGYPDHAGVPACNHPDIFRPETTIAARPRAR